MSLTLYSQWRATAPYRVRIGLALKGLDYAYEPVDLVAGAQHKPAYRAVNIQRLVPTLAIMSALGDPRGDSAEAIALQVRTYQMMKPLREVVRKAKALGIVIAASTDGSYGDGDDTARVRVAHDMEELVGCGFTPLQAITAATRDAARVLGIETRTGTVAVGLEADLLVVDRNPLTDTTTLFEPMLVVTDGRVALNRLDR